MKDIKAREEFFGTNTDGGDDETDMMSQEERRIYLIGELQKEIPEFRRHRIPSDEKGQWELLRALFNLRPPYEAGGEFLEIQDAMLRQMTQEKGITAAKDIGRVALDSRIALWKGDITTLKCDAIVNAANSKLLGCWQPNHSCIDNIIHTMSGVQLRIKCNEIMEKQGHDEPVGRAKITPAYNLPCRFVLHTVGPAVMGALTNIQEEELANCYRACFELVRSHELGSVAFCCISTGVFGFPADRAAEIAVKTVREELERSKGVELVVFDVFSDRDYTLYRNLLGEKEAIAK